MVVAVTSQSYHSHNCEQRLSVHLCPTDLTIRCDDRRAVVKFSKAGDTRISLQHNVGQVERSLRAQNQLDSFSGFDAISACDKRTARRTDGHTTTAYTSLA